MNSSSLQKKGGYFRARNRMRSGQGFAVTCMSKLNSGIRLDPVSISTHERCPVDARANPIDFRLVACGINVTFPCCGLNC